MWFIDFSTLVLILAAGFQLGIQAVFGVDASVAIFGVAGEKIIFILMGLSAVWQLLRQKFH